MGDNLVVADSGNNSEHLEIEAMSQHSEKLAHHKKVPSGGLGYGRWHRTRVGFRPSVWRLAQDHGIVGSVKNDGEG